MIREGAGAGVTDGRRDGGGEYGGGGDDGGGEALRHRGTDSPPSQPLPRNSSSPIA